MTRLSPEPRGRGQGAPHARSAASSWDPRAWAHARLDEQQALLRELVEIESPSDNPAGVERLALRLVRELEPTGLRCDLLPVDGGGPLLRARPAAQDGAARPVLLLGHLDTVWPVGTLAARPVRIDDGRLFGPGAYDMKAGLVVLVFALRALAERGRLPPVSVFLTPLEEVGGRPYRALMESEMRTSRVCLDFEPAWPGGAVKTTRKGSGQFTLRARGRAAHAGADFEKGRSAILELVRRVPEVAALTDLARGVTLNVGTIRGGIRPNVVPDLAEAEVDVRYTRLADGAPVEAALRGLRADTPDVTLEVEGSLHYPPFERTPAVAQLFETARDVARSLGGDLAEVATGGSSEASFAAALGLPALDGLGADGDGAHAEHEHVRLPSLPERVALTAALVARLTEA